MSQVLGRKRIPVFAIALAVALLLCVAVSVAADPPVASDDAYTTDEDTPLVVAAPGVLFNDSDPDGDVLTATLFSPPANGDLALDPDGGFVYTPTLNWNGVDTFGYLAADGSIPAVAYWPFDDNADPTADLSGNGHHGYLSGGVTFTTTVPITLGAGLALDLNGDDGYVLAGGDENDFDLNVLSVLFWVKVDVFDTDWQAMVTKGDTSWRVHRYQSTNRVAFSTSGLTTVDLPSNSSINDGQWHHVAAVYDGSTKYIYIDGALDISTPVAGTISANGFPVMIGENAEVPGRFFDGQLDDVRIHYRALSLPEIQAAMMGTPAVDRATVSITVTAIPDPPVANDDAYTTDEDTPLVVAAPGVLFNDSDPDGDVLTATLFSPPANGDLALDPDGGFVYTPTLNWNGVDTFGYLAADGSIPAVAYWPFDDNADPTADLSGNGHDGDLIGGVAFTTTVPITLGTGLALDLNGVDGYVLAGGDENDFDLNVLSVLFWVKVDVFDTEWQAMVTKGDSSWRVHRYQSTDRVAFGTTGLSNGDLPSNSSINDGQWHHVAAVYDGSTKYLYIDGALDASIAASGTINDNTYAVNIGRNARNPGREFDGQLDDVRIHYQALSLPEIQAAMTGTPPRAVDQATVSITVTAIPDPPVANDDAYAVSDDLILAVPAPGVLGNDDDPDSDVLTATLNSPTTLGVLALNGDGGFVYTPTEGITGTDIVSYTVSDGNAADIGWVTFTVQAVNDAPIAADDGYTTIEDTTLTIPAPGMLANDSDPDGDPLIAFLDIPPANGDLTLNPDGSFVYTPTLNWNGVDTFGYLAADGATPAVAYWPFDDNADPTADLSGNSHDGDLSGGVAFTTTVPITLGTGLALDLNGVDGYVLAGGDENDFDLNVLSVLFWVKVDVFDTEWQAIVTKGDTSWRVHRYQSTDRVAFGTTGLSNGDLPSNSSINDEQWHHVAAVYDGSTKYLYIDGVLDASIAASGTINDNTYAVNIGRNAQMGGREFDGQLDDVRIYYTPLTQTQVQAAMTGTSPEGIADRATVSITVTATPDPPVLMDDSYDPPIDGVLNVPAPGVLGNDDDPDGDVLTATLFSPPANGDLALNLDGSFVYTPTPGFEGLDGFVYDATDGQFTQSATVTLTVRHRRVTHSATRADQPDVAIDANGNVHIAYTDEYTTSQRELWYTMLDNDGNTLIDDTRITADDDHQSTRPAILVDSEDKVHILWRDQRWDDGSHHEVTYTKLDPYLDDMDGSPAISSTITLVDDTRMSNNNQWYILSVRAALDSNDDIHIVWDDEDLDAIHYKKIDADGNELVAEAVIRSASQWRATPYVAVDSNDNLHLTWADYGNTSSDEVYYMMLDNLGNTLIDATRLTPDDDEYSKWSSIVVDADDKVHIVWQDDSGADKEIWYTKLDPSLDDQDGDAAYEAAITLIDDTPLTPDDGVKSRHPVVGIDGRILHVTWEEDDTDNIHYSVLTNNGHFILDNYGLTTNGTAYPSTQWTMPYLAIDDDHRMHVVWCDSRDGAYEVYYTHYDWIYGYLNGHVYDAATLDPIEGATVSAGAGADTDAGGYYTMTIPIGVYTATAEHPWYTTAYSPGVQIVTDTLTTRNWYLSARGRLYGTVTDYDTGLPLGASVNVLGYGTTTSNPDTGYYEIYVDAGTYDLEALARDYLTGTATVDVISGQDLQQNFVLAYGVAFEPHPVHVTLGWQTTASFPATLTNRMTADYGFEFFENDEGLMPLAHAMDVGDFTLLSTPPVNLTCVAADPNTGYIYAQQDQGTSFYVYDPHTDVWTQLTSSPQTSGNNGGAAYLDGKIYTSYTGNGTMGIYDIAGGTWSTMASPLGRGGGAMASDGQYLYLAVGSGFQRYDPSSDTWAPLATPSIDVQRWGGMDYYDGSLYVHRGDGLVEFARYDVGSDAWTTLPSLPGGATLSGAIDPMSPTYFAYGDYGGTNWYMFDIENETWSVGTIPFWPVGDGGMAHVGLGGVSGIYFVHGEDGQGFARYETLPTGRYVPWLGEQPISGTIPAGSTLNATLLFSATYAAGVDQPGDYDASLLMFGNPRLETPVRMTVLPPASMGKVEGHVLDRCLGKPVEATIHITAGNPITETTAFPDGTYAAWLVEGSYELAFTADGYLTHTASVSVTAGTTTTLDVILFPDRACIQVEPDTFEVWLITGTLVYTHPTGLDIANPGGQDLDYEILEVDRGYLITGTLVYPHPTGLDITNPGAQDLDYTILEVDRGYLTPTLGVRTTMPAIPLPAGVTSSDDVDTSPTAPSRILGTGVLLIQDSPAWGYDAWTAILTANGIPFDTINSTQIPVTDFSPYKMIAIPSVQGSTYNTNFNNNLAKFEAFIDAGGILLMSFCTQSSHTPYIQPPFGGTNNYQGVDYNYIKDLAHPIFAGVPNPYWGRSASHNHMSDLLPDDRILVTQGTAPGGNVVMIERDHGKGMLVAGGQTFEYGWGHGQDAGLILENMIPYYYNWLPPRDVPWLWEEPVSGTVPSDVLAPTNVHVMFTALYTDWVTPMPLGTYSATLKVMNNDPVASTPKLPVTMHIVEQYVTPTASFTSNSPVDLGVPMVFTNTTTGGVPPASLFGWDFDDGVTSTLEHPSHVYATDGTYTVTLTACSPDPSNLCDSYQDQVVVSKPFFEIYLPVVIRND